MLAGSASEAYIVSFSYSKYTRDVAFETDITTHETRAHRHRKKKKKMPKLAIPKPMAFSNPGPRPRQRFGTLPAGGGPAPELKSSRVARSRSAQARKYAHGL